MQLRKARILVELTGDDPALDELRDQVDDDQARYDWLADDESEAYLFEVITKGFRYTGVGVGINGAIRACGEAISSGLRQRWSDPL